MGFEAAEVGEGGPVAVDASQIGVGVAGRHECVSFKGDFRQREDFVNHPRPGESRGEDMAQPFAGSKGLHQAV